jgi:hypothetical protein
MMGASAGQLAGSGTPKKATMRGSAKTAGRLAAVGAVALVLAGAVATPAEARPKTPRWVEAEDGECADAGGDPTLFAFFGVYAVACDYGEGDVEVITG